MMSLKVKKIWCENKPKKNMKKKMTSKLRNFLVAI